VPCRMWGAPDTTDFTVDGASSVSRVEKNPTADAFAERLFESTLGAFELLSLYVGDRLGWYRALSANGAMTSAELAARTGTSERYTREWLEFQAVSGILTAEFGGADSSDAQHRRFHLPSGAAEVLTDETSLAYLGPMARMVAAAAVQLPHLLDAYRTGAGVSWQQLGTDARESQADMNRPWYEQRLGAALREVPDIDEVLARPGARVADVGCGAGWSTIALARAYPGATFEGIDIDEASVEMACHNAEAADIADRVSFHIADGSSVAGAARYDAAFAFECVHDMPRPVEVLAAIRKFLKPDGVLVIMDEAVAEEFTAPGDDLERLMYGFSMFVCLPDGMSSQPSAATGTVMRPATLRRYAEEAGFSRLEIAPIENFGFWRFYVIRP